MTQAFNLSQLANKVNSSGELDLATGVTGLLPVNEGGTGQTTYTNGQLLIGNTTGNTLTKSTLTGAGGVTITNGAGSITISSAAGQIQSEIFTGPGVWTCPSTTTQARVTVIGGGGSGQNPPTGQAGGTSSFGPAVSATGGAASAAGASPGTGTVSVGTTLKRAFVSGTVTYNAAGPTVTMSGQVGSNYSIGSITGEWLNGSGRTGSVGTGPSPGIAYSTTMQFVAGAAGGQIANATSYGAGGGVAQAIVPVSAPVNITVGAGGAAPANQAASRAGIGGAVLVEWVS